MPNVRSTITNESISCTEIVFFHFSERTKNIGLIEPEYGPKMENMILFDCLVFVDLKLREKVTKFAYLVEHQLKATK